MEDTTSKPLEVERVDGVLVFSSAAIQELCGGEFPDSGNSKHWPSGFFWNKCEYHLENGELVPYGGGLPAPGPNLRLVIAE